MYLIYVQKHAKSKQNAVVEVGFEFMCEKNTDPAKFCMLIKNICVKHLDMDVVK
jgi:hypothetical protein